MSSNTVASPDQVKQLKRHLEVWREAVLPVYSILVWEEDPKCPLYLIASSTTFFLSVWYCNPSVLTTLATLGLLATCCDYGIHLYCSFARQWNQGDKWTGKDEKKLEEVCRNIVSTQACIVSSFTSFFEMRSTRTKTYYAITIMALSILSCIGSSVNNLFFTYLIVTCVLLLPGMIKRGFLHQLKSTVMSSFCGGKSACKKSD